MSAPTRRGTIGFVLGVVAVTALAAALRFTRLGAWSFWSDEAFTISDAGALFAPRATGRLPEHRLSFALYGLFFEWVRAQGYVLDEWFARCLPALFGVAGVAATAALGARAAGRNGALLGALLVALSPFHLYWSQNARSYALEVALAVPAALLLGSALLAGRIVPLVAGTLLMAAAAFAHPTALALVPPLLVFGVVAHSGDKPIAWGVLLAAAAAIAAAVGLSPLGRAIWVHFRVKSDASPVLFLSTVAFYFRPTLLAAAAALGAAGIARRDRATLFLALLGFGALFCGFAASCLVRANAQYVVAALPFLALLAGREIARLPRGPAAALALVLVADFAGGAFLYFGPEHGHRASWREACELVRKQAGPDDLLVSTQSPIVECYVNPANPLPREAQASLYIGSFEPEKFETMTRLGRRIWFLVLDVDLEDWGKAGRERIRTFLREQCRAVAEWPLLIAGKDQTLRVWRFDPS